MPSTEGTLFQMPAVGFCISATGNPQPLTGEHCTVSQSTCAPVQRCMSGQGPSSFGLDGTHGGNTLLPRLTRGPFKEPLPDACAKRSCGLVLAPLVMSCPALPLQLFLSMWRMPPVVPGKEGNGSASVITSQAQVARPGPCCPLAPPACLIPARVWVLPWDPGRSSSS